MSVKLDKNNFKQEISQGLVMVDFYTDWCGPCRMLAPVLEQLTNVKVGKVDGEVSQDLIEENNIHAYPTLIFFRDGIEVQRLIGVHAAKYLQSEIDRLNG